MAGDVSELDHFQHQYDLKAKRVVDVGSTNQTIVFAKAANITYIGLGARGLATSETGWLVTKIDESADPTTIKHAIGILDDKATLTYT